MTGTSETELSRMLNLKVWKGPTQHEVGAHFTAKKLELGYTGLLDYCSVVMRKFDKARIDRALVLYQQRNAAASAHKAEAKPEEATGAGEIIPSATIYLFENVDGTKYIGKTKQSLSSRVSSHWSKRNKAAAVDPWLEKAWEYWKSNAKVIPIVTLTDCTQSILDDLEEKYIKQYAARHPGKLLNVVGM